MSTILIVLLVTFVVLSILLIFWGNFRRWLGQNLSALWALAVHYVPMFFKAAFKIVGIYSRIVAWVALGALVLIVAAPLLKAPALTAIAFILALTAILLAWMPLGIILRVFRVNRLVIPGELRMFVAWVAFLGFVGLIFPDVLTFKAMLGVALIGFISLAVIKKINAIDKIIWPLVIVMCLTIGWKHFFPEGFRSTTRYTASWYKKINTTKDRGSINNETDAATTYGVILKDVNTLYYFTGENLGEESCNLERGTIVRIANHKQEVKVVDGQGFVCIQLKKTNGSFVNGRKLWIEAEYVQLATPRDLVPKDDNLLSKAAAPVKPAPKSEVGMTPVVRDSIFGPGEYDITVQGIAPFNIVIISKYVCRNYSLIPVDGQYDYDVILPGQRPQRASKNLKINDPEVIKFQLKTNQTKKFKLFIS
jgi:hypothetical protein